MKKPRIRAEFVLDGESPVGTEDEEGATHYEIKLSMEGLSDDVYSVTYVLDESYYEQVNEVREKPDFALEITSYGDYEVQAMIRKKGSLEAASVWLSDALKRSHPNPNQEIKKALADIEEN